MQIAGDIWYRFADYFIDDWSRYALVCHEFEVIEVTAKTVVLVDAEQVAYGWDDATKDYTRKFYPDYVKRHRVLRDAHKRFAYPTKILALQSYRIRKMREQQILEARLDRCKASRATASLMAGLLELPTNKRNM